MCFFNWCLLTWLEKFAFILLWEINGVNKWKTQRLEVLSAPTETHRATLWNSWPCTKERCLDINGFNLIKCKTTTDNCLKCITKNSLDDDPSNKDYHLCEGKIWRSNIFFFSASLYIPQTHPTPLTKAVINSFGSSLQSSYFLSHWVTKNCVMWKQQQRKPSTTFKMWKMSSWDVTIVKK